MLEGRGGRALDSGAMLMPTLEAGLRYDGGDAETGAGLEVGAGLGYATGRLTVKVEVRGLLVHEDTQYEEFGLSGTLIYAPREDGRGLSMTMASARGVAESGVQALWSRQDMEGLAGGGAVLNAGQRFGTRIGYGMDGPAGRALWVPYIGTDTHGDTQALRLGVTLSSGPNAEAGLELGERNTGPGVTERAAMLSGSLRFEDVLMLASPLRRDRQRVIASAGGRQHWRMRAYQQWPNSTRDAADIEATRTGTSPDRSWRRSPCRETRSTPRSPHCPPTS